MNARLWITRAFYAFFMLGSVAAIALWIVIITAKCEGFGCLGVGAMVGMVFMVQLASMIAGGALMWLQRHEGHVPKGVLILETLHALPVLLFIGRMVLS